MLGWIRRRRFETEVRGCILALLGQIDSQFEKDLLRAYPGIREAIRRNWEAGDVTPETTAIFTAVSILTKIVETEMNEDTKVRVLAQLQTSPNDDEKEPFLRRVEFFVFIAQNFVDEGGAAAEDLEVAVSEIVGALENVSAKDRSVDRITRLLRSSMSGDDNLA